MGWFQVLQLVLSLASFIARHVERAKIEKAFADALKSAIGDRADAAVAAHSDVMSGRVPIDPNSPARRD